MLPKHEANPQENNNAEVQSQQSRFATLLKLHPHTDTPTKICSISAKHPLPYLLERGYSEKVIRKEILRARAIPMDALLEKVNNQEKQNKIIFNITYHLVFRDVRKVLEELHVILASDDGHKKVFPDVPMTV